MTSSNGNIFRVTGLCAGNSPGTGELPAQMASNAEYVCPDKWPVTRNMFPFDDVIMINAFYVVQQSNGNSFGIFFL